MKKLKEILGKFFTIAAFIIFTIAWSLFVYVLEGEWLYFVPLFVGDFLFWETFLAGLMEGRLWLDGGPEPAG